MFRDPKTTTETEALRHYDHLLLMDGLYGRRDLNDWEQKRFGEMCLEAIKCPTKP